MIYGALAVMIRDIARAEREGRATPDYMALAADLLKASFEGKSRLVAESDELFGPGEEPAEVVPEVQELEYPQE